MPEFPPYCQAKVPKRNRLLIGDEYCLSCCRPRGQKILYSQDMGIGYIADLLITCGSAVPLSDKQYVINQVSRANDPENIDCDPRKSRSCR